MTEYDYSPEAYERYMAKQNSVARWIEHQSQEAPRYGNPFILSNSVAASIARAGADGSSGTGSGSSPRSNSPEYGHRRAYDRDRGGGGGGSGERSGRERDRDRRDRDRDRAYDASRITRSHTVHDTTRSRHHGTHTYTTTPVYPAHGTGPNSYSYTSLDLPSSRHHRSHQQHPPMSSRPKHSRSYSYAQNPAAAYSTGHLRTYNGGHHTTHAYGTHTQAQHAQPTPYAHGAHAHGAYDVGRSGNATYKSAPGQPVVIPAGRDTYVVYPGGRRAVEVRSPTRHNPNPSSSSHSLPVSPTSPTPKKQSLFRRLFAPSSNSNVKKSAEAIYVYPNGGNARDGRNRLRRRAASMH